MITSQAQYVVILCLGISTESFLEDAQPMAVFGQHVSTFIEEFASKEITRQNVAVASVWRFARGEDIM